MVERSSSSTRSSTEYTWWSSESPPVRWRQQVCLLRLPGSKGLVHVPFYRLDQLQSLGSGQIGRRLWRSWPLIYAQQTSSGLGRAAAAAQQQIPRSVHQLHGVVLAAAVGMVLTGTALPRLVYFQFAQPAAEG